MTKGRHDPRVGICAVPVGEAVIVCVLAGVLPLLRRRSRCPACFAGLWPIQNVGSIYHAEIDQRWMLIMAMYSFRKTIVIGLAMTLLGAVSISAPEAQTSVDPRFKTVAEMATAIARTIDASLPKTTDRPLNFHSATSHENIVEVIYTATDVATIAKIKVSADKYKRDTVSYFCKAERLPYVNAGVVIRNVVAASDGSDRIETTIDRSACASLPPPPTLADSKTLSEMARTVAQAENKENASKQPANDPVRFGVATAHESIVEVRYTIDDAAVGQRMSANRVQIVGFLQGSSCFKYGDDLRRGLSFHYVFNLTDNSPVMEFTFDKSSC